MRLKNIFPFGPFPGVNKHRLDAPYYSVVDEPQLS
jgi:hypothetical protein